MFNEYRQVIHSGLDIVEDSLRQELEPVIRKANGGKIPAEFYSRSGKRLEFTKLINCLTDLKKARDVHYANKSVFDYATQVRIARNKVCHSGIDNLIEAEAALLSMYLLLDALNDPGRAARILELREGLTRAASPQASEGLPETATETKARKDGDASPCSSRADIAVNPGGQIPLPPEPIGRLSGFDAPQRQEPASPANWVAGGILAGGILALACVLGLTLWPRATSPSPRESAAPKPEHLASEAERTRPSFARQHPTASEFHRSARPLAAARRSASDAERAERRTSSTHDYWVFKTVRPTHAAEVPSRRKVRKHESVSPAEGSQVSRRASVPDDDPVVSRKAHPNDPPLQSGDDD